MTIKKKNLNKKNTLLVSSTNKHVVSKTIDTTLGHIVELIDDTVDTAQAVLEKDMIALKTFSQKTLHAAPSAHTVPEEKPEEP